MTAQAGDRLLLDDKDCELYAYPELPPHHPRVIERTELEARAAFGASWIFSTGCWRRYCARWAIRGDRLYLDGIDGIYRLDGEDPLFASWVTTTLRIPQGEMLCYIHLGDSIFERDLVIDIKRGMVVERYEVDNWSYAESMSSWGDGVAQPALRPDSIGFGKRDS